MKYSSNFDDPGSFFDEALEDFGLDSPSRHGGTVGHRAAETIARNIRDRGRRFEGPNHRWQGNSPTTIRAKGRDAPNHDTEQMLSLEQIEGEIAVTRAAADMVYGKDEENKAKAHYAHEGQSHLKIKRPFFDFNDADADQVLDGLCDDIINNFVRG